MTGVRHTLKLRGGQEFSPTLTLQKSPARRTRAGDQQGGDVTDVNDDAMQFIVGFDDIQAPDRGSLPSHREAPQPV